MVNCGKSMERLFFVLVMRPQLYQLRTCIYREHGNNHQHRHVSVEHLPVPSFALVATGGPQSWRML